MTLSSWWATLTWKCMVCGDTRPDDRIDVAHRPVAGLEHLFPGARWNVRFCNDSPECEDTARAPGPWPGMSRSDASRGHGAP